MTDFLSISPAMASSGTTMASTARIHSVLAQFEKTIEENNVHGGSSSMYLTNVVNTQKGNLASMKPVNRSTLQLLPRGSSHRSLTLPDHLKVDKKGSSEGTVTTCTLDSAEWTAMAQASITWGSKHDSRHRYQSEDNDDNNSCVSGGSFAFEDLDWDDQQDGRRREGNVRNFNNSLSRRTGNGNARLTSTTKPSLIHTKEANVEKSTPSRQKPCRKSKVMESLNESLGSLLSMQSDDEDEKDDGFFKVTFQKERSSKAEAAEEMLKSPDVSLAKVKVPRRASSSTNLLPESVEPTSQSNKVGSQRKSTSSKTAAETPTFRLHRSFSGNIEPGASSKVDSDAAARRDQFSRKASTRSANSHQQETVATIREGARAPSPTRTDDKSRRRSRAGMARDESEPRESTKIPQSPVSIASSVRPDESNHHHNSKSKRGSRTGPLVPPEDHNKSKRGSRSGPLTPTFPDNNNVNNKPKRGTHTGSLSPTRKREESSNNSSNHNSKPKRATQTGSLSPTRKRGESSSSNNNHNSSNRNSSKPKRTVRPASSRPEEWWKPSTAAGDSTRSKEVSRRASRSATVENDAKATSHSHHRASHEARRDSTQRKTRTSTVPGEKSNSTLAPPKQDEVPRRQRRSGSVPNMQSRGRAAEGPPSRPVPEERHRPRRSGSVPTEKSMRVPRRQSVTEGTSSNHVAHNKVRNSRRRTGLDSSRHSVN